MRKKFTLIILLLLTTLSTVFAQSVKISGKVTDNTGNTLPGVTITVKGTSLATSSDVNGNYSITAPANSILVYTFVGYAPQAISAGYRTNINVVLQSTASSLDEVVVVGYGTQKSAKVSSSVSTLKSADIQKDNPVRIEDAIQGRVSGVQIVQSGSPGVDPLVLVRGAPSYTGSAPLVVIDGVEQTITDFNSLSPADVESVSVLKDAAATAIYGINGGNGVILVTTKTGKKGEKTTFNFNGSYGIQQVAHEVSVLNATQYAAMLNEGSTMSGGGLIFPNLSTVGVGTNWQDQVFKNAPLQTYELSARGGSDKMTYFLAFNSTEQDGIIGGGRNSVYDRNNFTANFTFDLTSKLKFNFNVTNALIYSKGVSENSFNSVLGEALNFDPTVPVYNTVPNTIGKYGFSTLELQEDHNPLTTLDNTYNKTLGNKTYGKFEFQYEVIKGLTLTSRFGYTYYNNNSKTFNPLVFYGLNNVDNTLNADGSTVAGDHNSVTQSRLGNFNWDWESYANYNFSVAKDNHFEAVVGTSLYRDSGNSFSISRQDVPFNSYTYADINGATGVNTKDNTAADVANYYRYSDKKLSYFARLNYDYNEKYLFSASDRIDGDQVFGPNKRFANFYSGSLGWVVSKEDFFSSNLITFLKFRGSYGTSGNSNAGNAQVSSIISGGPYNNIGNSNGYTFGDTFYPGSTVGTLANLDLSWETDKQTDVGFDLELIHKFNLNFDLYKKDISGLLFQPTQSLYLGTIPASFANIGTTSTKGIDATLGYNDRVSKDFGINTSVTFSLFRSVVTATNQDNSAIQQSGYFFNGQSQPATIFKVGYGVSEFYGYKTDGLFQNGAEIKASATQPGAQPGDIRYVDVNHDGVINSADQTALGSPFPKFTIGWNLNLTYKQFDFSSFLYISEGNKIFTAWDRNGNFTNKPSTILARWTGEGSTNDAQDPRYTFSDPNDNARVSDRYIQDGSFAKIKNVVLGYTLPKDILGTSRTLRIYAQVRNAYTFTKYTGFDPEVSGGILSSGVDYGQYPQARTYLLGVDFRF